MAFIKVIKKQNSKYVSYMDFIFYSAVPKHKHQITQCVLILFK